MLTMVKVCGPGWQRPYFTYWPAVRLVICIAQKYISGRGSPGRAKKRFLRGGGSVTCSLQSPVTLAAIIINSLITTAVLFRPGRVGSVAALQQSAQLPPPSHYYWLHHCTALSTNTPDKLKSKWSYVRVCQIKILILLLFLNFMSFLVIG